MRYLIVILFFPFFGNSQNWVEIWSDEFDGTSLDLTKWVYEIGTGSWGWGNNELQYYTANSDNIFVDAGFLNIVGRQELIGGSNYSSARIKTQGLFDFQYGKVEARIKVPIGQGIWPAFWMLGSNITSVSWPLCGEIDIMEHVNNELKIHGTIHYDMWGYAYEGDFAYTDAAVFHNYSVEWDENEIRWYLDGTEYFSTNIGEGSTSREEFHNPFFLLVNLAIGGNWPGGPDSTTSFPATMQLDYVRVYQATSAGLNEIDNVTINVNPNPSSNQIKISSEVTLASYAIYSLQGEKLLEGKESTIDISKISAGIYFIDVQLETGKHVKTSFIRN